MHASWRGTHILFQVGNARIKVLALGIELVRSRVAFGNDLVGRVVDVLQARLRLGEVALKGRRLALRGRERLRILYDHIHRGSEMTRMLLGATGTSRRRHRHRSYQALVLLRGSLLHLLEPRVELGEISDDLVVPHGLL